jgi:hypothetical protein
VIKLGELVMILDLHRQGLSVSAIARQAGVDRRPSGPTSPKGWSRLTRSARRRRVSSTASNHTCASAWRPIPPYPPGVSSARSRTAAFPAAIAWSGTACASFGRPAAPDTKRASRPRQASRPRSTSPRFEVEFADEPGVKPIIWLFSMVLGYSRLIRARFVLHQDLVSSVFFRFPTPT